LKTVPNLSVNHIAISVPDATKAIEWYTSILGFQQIGEIREFKRKDANEGGIFSIYGPELKHMKVGFLTSANGIGVELFQFIDPPQSQQKTPFAYAQGGLFHFCVTDKQPEELVKKIVANGGSKMGETCQLLDNEEEAIYAKDPWGNVIEVLSFSFDRLASRLSY
jgi:catechol 2,3-dioxygenase-like lactoylglutathione lyase family enzyme